VLLREGEDLQKILRRNEYQKRAGEKLAEVYHNHTWEKIIKISPRYLIMS
jgi:hypothetical protein